MTQKFTTSVEDGVSAELHAKIAQLQNPKRLHARIGPPLMRHWRDHLKKFPRLPGKFQSMPPTGFGEQAARSLTYRADEIDLELIAAKQGLKQRFHGGIIKPVRRTCLVFGIKPESYGKTLTDFGWRPGLKDTELNKRLRLLFAFAKQVKQRPNPNVIPPDMPQRVAEEMDKGVAAIITGGRAGS